VNERKNQIITVSADKKIKIFDIRTFRCTQTLVDTTPYQAPDDHLTAAAFDLEHQRLITAGNKIRMWPVQIAPGNKSGPRGGPAHNNLIVAICYSPTFKQVVRYVCDIVNVQFHTIYMN